MLETLAPSGIGWTAADIVEHFGAIPMSRIRRDVPLGEATEEDVVQIYLREKRLCELVDGILVEKTVGAYESYLAILIARLLGNFVANNNAGIVLGADGMMRLAPSLVRIPDVSFIAIDQLPGGKVPRTAMAHLAPALAVEIISPSNTKKEMQRKLTDYFAAGVRLVWYVYPNPREVHVFTSASDCVVLTEREALTGGAVLPGFSVTLAEIFAEPNAPQK